MADRARTLLGIFDTPSAFSASAGPWYAGFDGRTHFNRIYGQQWGAMLNSPASGGLPAWVRYDFGTAKTFDSAWMDTMATYSSIKDFKLQYSTDDSTWNDAYTNTDFWGGAPAGSQFKEFTFTAQTARYWRLYINHLYNETSYGGCSNINLWNSALIGARLDNAPPTITILGAFSTADQTNVRGNSYAAYYWYKSMGVDNIASWKTDFGSAKYIGGFDFISYSAGFNFRCPTEIYVSTDGTNWTYAETVALATDTAGTFLARPFGKIYYTRYIKFRFVGSGASGCLLYLWRWYETLVPAVPSDPTALKVSGGSTDNTTIQLNWSHAGASDDNLAADIDYEVQRSKDGGAYATVATITAAAGVSAAKQWVDTGLAAGSYTYKVRAVNRYHARVSGYTAASTAIVTPVAAAGGGPRVLVGASR